MSRKQHIKAIESAMGMAFTKLNKLRDQLVAARKAGDATAVAVVAKLIDAAHAAKAAYVEGAELNPYTLDHAPAVYAKRRAAAI